MGGLVSETVAEWRREPLAPVCCSQQQCNRNGCLPMCRCQYLQEHQMLEQFMASLRMSSIESWQVAVGLLDRKPDEANPRSGHFCHLS
jgi:hypothetical protein